MLTIRFWSHFLIKRTTKRTTKNNTSIMSLSIDMIGNPSLSFPFRDRRVPVTFVSSVTFEHAQMAVCSEPFVTWYRRCERVKSDNKRLEIHAVTIQSVDLFGARKVGFVKIVSNCTYFDGKQHHDQKLPGICFLRGNAVSIFVALFCDEISADGKETITKEYSILVEQPRVPIGVASILELPAGMIDDDNESVAGIAVKEMQEECGILIQPSDLIDLTELALHDVVKNGRLPIAALPPSGGGCDEFVRYMYLEKKVTTQQLSDMKGKLSGLRDHGEFITLSVVPMKDVWKVSGDAKAMISLFLLDQLRKEGKLPEAGRLATSLCEDENVTKPPTFVRAKSNRHIEQTIKLKDQSTIPQLAFGMYLVPNDDSGEQTVIDAINAGYRHFDCASFYGNETIVGKAIRKSCIAREEFCIATKVWKDALREGRASVRKSVLDSISKLECGGYVDICYIHWPVPGHFTVAYHELESLYSEGKIRSIGLSNFTRDEYKTLIQSGISVLPVVNQMEVSVVMYRPDLIEYFRSIGMAIVAFKPLNRGGAFESILIQDIASRHDVSPAQIMLRWCIQKGLTVISKTSNAERMLENRSLFNFSLEESEMTALDSLTNIEDMRLMEQKELDFKLSL